jgi:ornithine cyclodeaminase/alanine dehydrogenase-like protein (mu-crystallin family)
MREARDIRRVRIWNLTFERAKAFADQYNVEVVETVEEAVSGADIICTLTGSPDPIMRADWLAPGVHINAVGSSTPTALEDMTLFKPLGIGIEDVVSGEYLYEQGVAEGIGTWVDFG